jgi:hypothetical protein
MLENVKKYGELATELTEYVDGCQDVWNWTFHRLTWPHLQKRIRAEIDKVQQYEKSFHVMFQVMSARKLAKDPQDLMIEQKLFRRWFKI